MRKRRSMKREHRKAIRVSLAIFLATVAGYSVDLESGDANEEFKQAACKWAAITAAIVAQPLLGSVVRTGAERVLGTLCGGVTGLLVHQSLNSMHFSDAVNGLIKAAVCSVLAAAAILVGEKKYKLNYSAKLFQITMLLVTFAAESSDETEHLYFISRVAGIASGVLIMLLLSVVLVPKSATNEALKELGDAVADLIALTDELFSVQGGDASTSMLLERDQGSSVANRFSLLAENLAQMQDNIEISRYERSIARAPSLILLPRLFPSKDPVLPAMELNSMANEVRQVSGSLDFLHRASVGRGGGEGLDEFIGSLRGVLVDVKDAFPSRRLVDDPGAVRRLDALMDTAARHNRSDVDPVIRAALDYAAHDAEELWRSCDAVVPLLPTCAPR
jgi:uncharacterized membrane protein YgaE (UPF0421/DUF939 family)